MKVIGIIPARLASTRLPRKVLLDIAGKPLLWHVYHSALKARSLDQLIVAADDPQIVEEMFRWNIPCMLTSIKHRSGTERAGEVALKLKADVYINIQGDEPMIAASNIEMIASKFKTDKQACIVTLKTKMSDPPSIVDPNNVKVVTDVHGRALYFSRAAIPFDRDAKGKTSYFKHIGIYGYRRNTLLEIVQYPSSKLEESEKLEQLRFMDHGVFIDVLETKIGSIGVDTVEDLKQVRKLLQRKKK